MFALYAKMKLISQQLVKIVGMYFVEYVYIIGY